ncbi:MAG: T9SS type A sorting domain-containing protein, partial [Muribaculaceae bacterium]|nr:T9SS type A sorting domain-containing protein [Muribaculaceae bacterium]
VELHHLKAINVYRGDALIDSIFEPGLGAHLEAVDLTLVEPGFYEYSIVAITDKHVSDTVTVATAWVGLDTAVAPEATVECFEDGTATLYIEHSGEGLHGGYVGEVRYRVVSSVDGQIEDATTDTQIDLAEPESLDVYSFTVWAFGQNNEESEPCATESVAMGKAILLPHDFDFGREEIFMIWEMGDWAYESETKSVATNQASQMATPPFLAQRGEVAFSFYAEPMAGTAELDFALLDEDMQLVSESVTVVANSDANQQCIAIVPVPAEGVYRLSIEAKQGVRLLGASLSQYSVDGINSVDAGSGITYDSATGILTAKGLVRVYTASGMFVRSIDADGSVSLADLASGVYIITCGNSSFKIIK